MSAIWVLCIFNKKNYAGNLEMQYFVYQFYAESSNSQDNSDSFYLHKLFCL